MELKRLSKISISTDDADHVKKIRSRINWHWSNGIKVGYPVAQVLDEHFEFVCSSGARTRMRPLLLIGCLCMSLFWTSCSSK